MPGIAVNVAVIKEGKILLTKRDDFETWILPSGGVEEGESVAQAAIRETKEETGLDVELTGLVGVYSRLGTLSGVPAVLFSAKPIGGKTRCQEGETIAVEWFAFDAIPSPLSMGHRKRIEDAISGARGVAVMQENFLPAYPSEKLTWEKLTELRDRSGLSRQEFWLQLVEEATTREDAEVAGYKSMPGKNQKWLDWAREIQALTQTGLTYNQNEFDIQRYRRLEEIASEIVAAHSTLPTPAILDSFRLQPGYATPKIDVRGAVIHEGKILLVQEKSDGKWCMPGGWADVGDLPSAMVEREVWEESGFRVKAAKVIAVYDANRVGAELMQFYHAYKIIFQCTMLGGEARPSNETLAVGFFSLDDLPPLSTSRTNERMLQEVFAHLENLNRPAAFD